MSAGTCVPWHVCEYEGNISGLSFPSYPVWRQGFSCLCFTAYFRLAGLGVPGKFSSFHLSSHCRSAGITHRCTRSCFLCRFWGLNSGWQACMVSHLTGPFSNLLEALTKYISNTFLLLILDSSAKLPSTTSMQLEGVISIKRKKQEVKKNSTITFCQCLQDSCLRWESWALSCSTKPLLCAVHERHWQEGCQVAAVSLHASGKCTACLPRPLKRAKF